MGIWAKVNGQGWRGIATGSLLVRVLIPVLMLVIGGPFGGWIAGLAR